MPASRIGRVVLALWLAACFALLLFAFEQRAVHDMPVAFTWLMIGLTFPVGLVATPAASIGFSALSNVVGLSYHPFFSLFPVWLVLVAAGYWQWFVVLPALVRFVRGARAGA